MTRGLGLQGPELAGLDPNLQSLLQAALALLELLPDGFDRQVPLLGALPLLSIVIYTIFFIKVFLNDREFQYQILKF